MFSLRIVYWESTDPWAHSPGTGQGALTFRRSGFSGRSMAGPAVESLPVHSECGREGWDGLGSWEPDVRGLSNRFRMTVNKRLRGIWAPLLVFAMAAVPSASQAGASKQGACRKVELSGEVSAGQEWKAAIGEGWVFRVVPIPASTGYSGWDLVVDREQPAGFPDALLLATPPYNSINEREIATTFGLRAQDAIGWNPRAFRFLTDPAALKRGQELFQQIAGKGAAGSGAAASLLTLSEGAATGRFQILDSRVVPGIADPAPFAEDWALAAAKSPHTFETPEAGKSTPQGAMRWMRFSVRLWLPGGWKLPTGIQASPSPCPE